MARNVMVIGAHADDIEINTGGTLSKYLQRGYNLIYVMSTNNMSGAVGKLDENGKKIVVGTEPPRDMMPRRKGECDVAARALGTTPIHLDHPQRHYSGEDGKQIELRYGQPRPDIVPENVPSILTAHEDKQSRQRVKELILEHNPEVIFTHGIAQIDMEHVGTALLVTRSMWEAVEEGYNGSLLHWREGHNFLGDLNTRWDTFIDYTGHVDRKMELIGMHDCQMPHWRDPDFGHRRRAYEFGSICGCEGAELYVWVRRADHPGGGTETYGALTLELIRNTR